MLIKFHLSVSFEAFHHWVDVQRLLTVGQIVSYHQFMVSCLKIFKECHPKPHLDDLLVDQLLKH